MLFKKTFGRIYSTMGVWHNSHIKSVNNKFDAMSRKYNNEIQNLKNSLEIVNHKLDVLLSDEGYGVFQTDSDIIFICKTENNTMKHINLNLFKDKSKILIRKLDIISCNDSTDVDNSIVLKLKVEYRAICNINLPEIQTETKVIFISKDNYTCIGTN